MNIRTATIEDADGIIRLNDAFGYEYPPEKTREKLGKALKTE